MADLKAEHWVDSKVDWTAASRVGSMAERKVVHSAGLRADLMVG